MSQTTTKPAVDQQAEEHLDRLILKWDERRAALYPGVRITKAHNNAACEFFVGVTVGLELTSSPLFKPMQVFVFWTLLMQPFPGAWLRTRAHAIREREAQAGVEGV